MIKNPYVAISRHYMLVYYINLYLKHVFFVFYSCFKGEGEIYVFCVKFILICTVNYAIV